MIFATDPILVALVSSSQDVGFPFPPSLAEGLADYHATNALRIRIRVSARDGVTEIGRFVECAVCQDAEARE